jgi:hypothetical protein
VRCPRCGNDNPGTNRFCGMCGATLLQAPAPVGAGPAQGTAAADSTKPQAAGPAVRQESGPRPASSIGSPSNSSSSTASGDSGSSSRAASNGDDAPVISGPSFLGLNQRSPHPAYSSGRRRGSLSIDPHTSSGSRNLEYLLEDDDESSGGGALKFVLIFVALVLAIGLGYLRWKNEGLEWLTSVTKKPSAATQPVPDGNASAPNSSNAPSTAPAGAPPVQPVPSQPAPSTSSSPAATTLQGATPPSSASPSPAAPSTAAPTSSEPSTASPPANPETSSSPAASSPPAAGDADNSASDANSAAAQPSEKKEPSEDASEPAAKPEKPKSKPAAAPAKPTAAKPLVMGDPVAEAQRYLYGKGARQDCDRGLRILKPAAQAANAKAMVEMGALYSAGLCTPRDLPTAYRWFAMALRKDPDNQAIQTDLQKLWGEMTQPERQLAIRLTQ